MVNREACSCRSRSRLHYQGLGTWAYMCGWGWGLFFFNAVVFMRSRILYSLISFLASCIKTDPDNNYYNCPHSRCVTVNPSKRGVGLASNPSFLAISFHSIIIAEASDIIIYSITIQTPFCPP